MLCITFVRLACCCLSYKFWIGLDYDSTALSWLLVLTLQSWLFCHSHMGHWQKQICELRNHCTTNLARAPSRKWELTSNWLTAGKECGWILNRCLWGGALRDDTKNGCVADYHPLWYWIFVENLSLAKLIISINVFLEGKFFHLFKLRER